MAEPINPRSLPVPQRPIPNFMSKEGLAAYYTAEVQDVHDVFDRMGVQSEHEGFDLTVSQRAREFLKQWNQLAANVKALIAAKRELERRLGED